MPQIAMSSFSDPQAVARYADGPVKQVPGLHALQRMAALLLAETVPSNGQVLVLGAGGGLELKVFADAHADWRFVGVDPSAEMLKLAASTVGPLAARMDFIEGYITDAPNGPFDGATCLLTLHFLPPPARLATLQALFERLKPGTPLIVAHHSFPQDPRQQHRWLNRYAAFSAASGIPADHARKAAEAIAARLPLLNPEDDVALLQEAGFEDIELFYAGFTFKGWVAYKPVDAPSA